jgi:MFS family permease
VSVQALDAAIPGFVGTPGRAILQDSGDDGEDAMMPAMMLGWASFAPPHRPAQDLLAAALGWMLDAFDVMLLSMVLTDVMRTSALALDRGGLITTATLIASGFGGLLFGWLADRAGRRLALSLSILTYSVCSFLSGIAQDLWQLAAVRFVLGLGTWVASGTPERRWWRRPGPPSIAPRP